MSVRDWNHESVQHRRWNGGGGGKCPLTFQWKDSEYHYYTRLYSARFRLGTFKGCTGLKITSKNAVGNEADSCHVLSPGNHRASWSIIWYQQWYQYQYQSRIAIGTTLSCTPIVSPEELLRWGVSLLIHLRSCWVLDLYSWNGAVRLTLIGFHMPCWTILHWMGRVPLMFSIWTILTAILPASSHQE